MIFKEKLSYVFASVALGFGILLTFLGFLVDPMGVVDDSVLWVLGQTLIYSGSIVGISMHYKQELNNFKDDIHKLLKEKSDSFV